MLNKKLLIGICISLILISGVFAFGLTTSSILNYKINKETNKLEIINTKDVSLLDKDKIYDEIYLEETMYKDLVAVNCFNIYLNSEKELQITPTSKGTYCVTKKYLDEMSNNKFVDDYSIYEKELIK